MKILFLHLSDIHFENKTDISKEHMAGIMNIPLGKNRMSGKAEITLPANRNHLKSA